MENELKDLLRQKAGEFDLPGDIPQPVLRRARRRRLTLAALGACASLALIAGAFVGVRELVVSDAIRRPAQTPTPRVTGTETPSPTPSPTSPEAVVTATASPESSSAPPTFLALQALEGDPLARLVEVDSQTGQVLRVLLDGVDTSEGGMSAIQLAPDARTLYYGMGTAACTNDVRRLSLETGREEVLASGGAYAPALSPDGRLLAYADWSDLCFPTDRTIVVRDLGTGRETRWELSLPGTDEPFVRKIAWLADSRMVAYEVGDGEVGSVYLLDTASDPKIWPGEGQRMGPTGSSLELVGPHPEGLAALRKCLGPVGPDCLAQPEVVALDPDTGEISTILWRPAPDSRYDLDPAGRHFLYVVDDVVYRWSGGPVPVRITEGYYAAAW